MIVNELIEELQKCDGSVIVRVAIGYCQYEGIGVVCNSDHVLVGSYIPPECYEQDYKYED